MVGFKNSTVHLKAVDKILTDFVSKNEGEAVKRQKDFTVQNLSNKKLQSSPVLKA